MLDLVVYLNDCLVIIPCYLHLCGTREEGILAIAGRSTGKYKRISIVCHPVLCTN